MFRATHGWQLKETHIAVWEFYSPSIVRKINADRYYVLTTKEYLYELNKQITKIEARW